METSKTNEKDTRIDHFYFKNSFRQNFQWNAFPHWRFKLEIHKAQTINSRLDRLISYPKGILSDV